MDLRLDGRTAVITGGSSGMGKAIAKEFAEAGAQVLITSRKADNCAEAAAEIGHDCQWEAGHAGNADDAQRVIQAATDRLGGVDILVNNAGTNPYAGPLIDVDLARWQKTFDVNLTGPLVWTQLAWRHHMQTNGGVVINMSSVGAFKTSPTLGVYDITKAGLLTMTRQLAAELGPQVRVNALCPAVVKTEFSRMLWEGNEGEVVARSYPLGRFGEVDDITGAAMFLASDASAWMTGQVIVLDGGDLVKLE
jgi:NAD(P)-dependent dehydrogenase (short-subunit alcohol dehydrogenase family)